jgi:hypothetical protein
VHRIVRLFRESSDAAPSPASADANDPRPSGEPERLRGASVSSPRLPRYRPAWDEPEPDQADRTGDQNSADDGPSRTRLAALAAAASFAIVLLIAAGITVAQQWNQPDDLGAGDQGSLDRRVAGQAIAAGGYELRLPEGWTDRTAEMKAKLKTKPSASYEHILSGPSSKGTVASVTITKTQMPARQRSLDVLRQDFMIGLRQREKSAEPIGSPIYLEVASSQATSFEFRYSQQRLQIAGRAVIVSHDADVYLVLFQTGEVDYDLQVNALWDLLDSWRWRQ